MLCCPTLVISLWISLSAFGGSLTAAYDAMLEVGLFQFFSQYGPRPNFQASVGYGAWLLFQVTLYQFLPSKLSTGQLTPAGNLLKYRTNGLLAWFVTHVMFGVSAYFGLLNPAILANNWQGLLVSANVFGFLLSGLAYAKAVLSPTHAGDRKFSGKYTNSISRTLTDENRIFLV
jgi:7-dehydrocholesterol reductase